MDHRIEKTVELRAPVSKVWHVLTDENELREWFDAPIRPVHVEHERVLIFNGPTDPTLVELKLEPHDGGTLLKLSESGFEHVPIGRRGALFDDSDVLWTERLKRLERRVSA